MTKYYEMIKRHQEERKNFKDGNFLSLAYSQIDEIKKEIKKDTTGENFIKDMFSYEMDSAEYHINQYKESLLENMNITLDEFRNSKALMNGFNLAEKEYMKSMERYFYF